MVSLHSAISLYFLISPSPELPVAFSNLVAAKITRQNLGERNAVKERVFWSLGRKIALKSSSTSFTVVSLVCNDRNSVVREISKPLRESHFRNYIPTDSKWDKKEEKAGSGRDCDYCKCYKEEGDPAEQECRTAIEGVPQHVLTYLYTQIVRGGLSCLLCFSAEPIFYSFLLDIWYTDYRRPVRHIN